MDSRLRKYYEQGWETIWVVDKHYSPKSKVYHNRMLDAIKSLKIAKDAKFSMLDAGCGIGIYSMNILRRWKNCTLTGFDISTKQINLLNKRLSGYDFSHRALFYASDVSEFKIAKKFDWVMCTEVLEHLTDPAPALKRLYDAGKKDAHYIISLPLGKDPGKGWWFYRQTSGNRSFETQDKEDLDPKEKYFEFYHKHYNQKEAIQLLESNGFRVVGKRLCNFCVENKFIDLPYSAIAFYWLDKLVNFVTFNRWASQLTLHCVKK